MCQKWTTVIVQVSRMKHYYMWILDNIFHSHVSTLSMTTLSCRPPKTIMCLRVLLQFLYALNTALLSLTMGLFTDKQNCG